MREAIAPEQNTEEQEYTPGDLAIPVSVLKEGFPRHGIPDGNEVIKRLLAHRDNETTDLADSVFIEDPACYTDQERFEKERDWIMNDVLHPIAMSCDLPGPNSFYTTVVMDVPILLTRNEQGEAKAFINSCLHRGATLSLEESGRSRRLSCPYHGWTYSLDGDLIAKTNAEYFEGCDITKGDKLTALPLIEEGGFLHVGLTPDAKPNFEAQKGLLDVLKSLEYENWHLFDRRQWNREFNWKLAVDTFMETYHFQYAHKDTVGTWLLSGTTTADNWARCTRMAIPAISIDGLRKLPEEQWDAADHLTVMYHLFPCTTIVMQGYMASIVQMYPGKTIDSVEVYHSIYAPHKIEQEDELAFRKGFADLVNFALDEEDFPLSLSISRSSNVKTVDKLVFGRNEPMLQNFHAGVREVVEGK